MGKTAGYNWTIPSGKGYEKASGSAAGDCMWVELSEPLTETPSGEELMEAYLDCNNVWHSTDAPFTFKADCYYLFLAHLDAQEGYCFADKASASVNGKSAVVEKPGLEAGDVNVVYYFGKPTAASNPFVDLKEGKVYYDAVLWAVDRGITNGTDTTHFSPDVSCTRGQVVTFLWRAAGCPTADLSLLKTFKDSGNIATPYRSAVAWAVKEGITNGYADGTFQPTKTVSRAEFVTFLWRYFGKPAPKSTDNPFVDVSNTSVFKDAILWALGESITNGFDPTHFRPNQTCTRWQVVLFMFRAFD